jgi:CRISPR-associated endonuclease/helicase Cas3
VLLPAYAGLWATTSPVPAATPDPALFLHGPGISADVQIIWRADVAPDDEKWANLSLLLCPPSSLEAQSVWAARTWLRQAEDVAFADVPELAPESEHGERGRPCLRRDGECWVLASADSLQPGDTVVVPCGYGGCDTYGWDPQSRHEVADLGAEAHYRQRLKAALRITKATLANALFGHPSMHEIWQRIERVIPDDEDVDVEILRCGLLEIEDLPEIWVTLLRGMRQHRTEFIRVNESDPSTGFAI